MLMLPDPPPQTLDTTGMPLGLMPGATYTIASVTMPPQSLLCVFSDGIPEAMVEDEFYGEDRFLESARQRCHQPLEEVIDGAFADLRKFVGDAPLEDDATLLLLRRCNKAGETTTP
jgi:serine phosphatase RsbU (regulator of sigma subunit)